jgi:type II secretory ATPase GspE/PulE/Tfp pilus assembly ATPase PilB-like protein
MTEELPTHTAVSRPNNAALAAELTELLSVVEPSSVANMVLQRAFVHNATDIHLDPTTLGTRIRFRVDGVLQDILPIPAEKAAVLLSRIKVMSGMDVSERRHPQDGVIVADRNPGLPRDIRVGSSPTVNGERLVLRLMPDPHDLSSLPSLGFYESQLNSTRQLIGSPHGLLLVVGPVGSGKSTTVYSLLRELNTPERSVVTIEDPVERRLPGANQIQVDVKGGLTFVKALRGILRQDPDLICIGEIRDPETAQIACRAATTGVLVLSTLHANCTSSAIDVLRGFGIPSMTIADSLRGVIAQRLVRKVCPVSREEFSPDGEMKHMLNLHEHDDSVRIVRGLPTDENFNTGYAGRTATFETMVLNNDIRNAIIDQRATHEIQDLARHSGMMTLEDSARQKVFDKVTSIDELRRVMSDAHR